MFAKPMSIYDCVRNVLYIRIHRLMSHTRTQIYSHAYKHTLHMLAYSTHMHKCLYECKRTLTYADTNIQTCLQTRSRARVHTFHIHMPLHAYAGPNASVM